MRACCSKAEYRVVSEVAYLYVTHSLTVVVTLGQFHFKGQLTHVREAKLNFFCLKVKVMNGPDERLWLEQPCTSSRPHAMAMCECV